MCIFLTTPKHEHIVYKTHPTIPSILQLSINGPVGSPTGHNTALETASAALEGSQAPGPRRRYEDSDDVSTSANNTLPGIGSSNSSSASQAGRSLDAHAAAIGDPSSSATTALVPTSVSDVSAFDVFPTDLSDEYDPLRTNDYVDDVLAIRRARAEQEARDAELRRVMEEEEAERRRQREEAMAASGGNAAAASAAAMTRGGRGRGIDIMPAWMKQAQATAVGSGAVPGASSISASSSNQTADSPTAEEHSPLPRFGGPDRQPSFGFSDGRFPETSSAISSGSSSSSGGAGSGGGGKMGIGAKLLAKWGYEQGKGLGKDGSGLTAPLIHEKTGVRSGVIKVADNADDISDISGSSKKGNRDGTVHIEGHTYLSTVGGPPSVAAAAAAYVAAAAEVPVNVEPPPSRIVCLRNMVGPGEVDDELEDEVRGECEAKYGPVDSVFVYECDLSAAAAVRIPVEEAVRIIVAFKAVDSATRARADLNGRYFGGRMVRSSFFLEERFARFDFAPTAAEIAAAGGVR